MEPFFICFGIESDLRLQLWQSRKQVGDQTVVGNLEDGSILVLVDGHNDLTVLHTGQVLDRPEMPTAMYKSGATILPV